MLEQYGIQNWSRTTAIGATVWVCLKDSTTTEWLYGEKSTTIFGRVCAVLNTAGYVGEKANLWQCLWAEAVVVATKLEYILVSQTSHYLHSTISLLRKALCKKPTYLQWNWCGTWWENLKQTGKPLRKVYFCWIYADNHARNIYKMFNLQMKHVWTTQAVNWIWSIKEEVKQMDWTYIKRRFWFQCEKGSNHGNNTR